MLLSIEEKEQLHLEGLEACIRNRLGSFKNLLHTIREYPNLVTKTTAGSVGLTIVIEAEYQISIKSLNTMRHYALEKRKGVLFEKINTLAWVITRCEEFRKHKDHATRLLLSRMFNSHKEADDDVIATIITLSKE